jgi:RecB family exonuclease
MTQAMLKLDHLSWSSIQTFRTCPRRFFYRYVERAPEESTAASLVFGGAFHKAVESAHEAGMIGESVPEADDLMQAYDDSWAEGVNRGTKILYAKGEDAASLRELARRMLVAYLEYLRKEPPTTVIGVEHAQRVTMVKGAPPIEARLDLVEMRGCDLVVADLKTSRGRWSDDKTRENLPQLVLYAIALAVIRKELDAKRIVPRFIVVTKGKSPVVQVIEPVVTQDDVVRARQLVSDAWQAISAGGGFMRREGWQCKQCPYRMRCLGDAPTV